eukprot:Pgem_evm3s14615
MEKEDRNTELYKKSIVMSNIIATLQGEVEGIKETITTLEAKVMDEKYFTKMDDEDRKTELYKNIVMSVKQKV